MNAGAVDFEAKTDMNSPGSVQHFLEQLIVKIKNAVHAEILAPVQPAMTVGSAAWPGNGIKGSAQSLKKRLIVIGASTGGTEAIASVINALPPDMSGIIIVQHIPPVFSRMFSDLERIAAYASVISTCCWACFQWYIIPSQRPPKGLSGSNGKRFLWR